MQDGGSGIPLINKVRLEAARLAADENLTLQDRKAYEVALKMLYSDEVQTFGAKDLEETLPAEDSE